MPKEPLAQVPDAVGEYGRLRAIDTSGWKTTLCQDSCVIAHIPTRGQAHELRDFLIGRGLLSEVVALTPDQAEWAVVAISRDPER
jgi:hypothetical protein